MLDYSAQSSQTKREEADKQRLARYKKRWRYYNGEQDAMLPVRIGQPDDNVIINITRLIVDKSASFLFGKDLSWELQEGDTAPEEELLDEVWQRNRRMTLLNKCAVMAGIYGHGFIKTVPDGVAEGVPRMVLIEPEYVTVHHDDEDIESVREYVIQWEAVGEDGKPLYRRQTISKEGERWDVTNEIARGRNRWVPDPDKDDSWPWPFAPIIDWQNLPCPGSFYGLSDLEDVDEQDAINYIASKMNRIVRYHAHPKTYGAGFAPSDVRLDADDMTILPSPDAYIRNLEMSGDSGLARYMLDTMIEQYLSTTRTPIINARVTNIGAMSGFALRIHHMPLYEKTELKRRTYGDMLIELNRRILVMAGMGDDNRVTIHWQDPLPSDHAAEQARDQFDLDYKLASRETVRSRRGLDSATEEERIAADEAADGNIGAMLVQNWQNAQGTMQQQEQS